ncbi:hypothetical protein CCHOA_03235 [Corynebacterium choanae]|uniref:Uncharacterized protein n=1 Tax=Corynebacterium choanae TaxID=1862358 RepID=A0A3G6J545_9CORY|nr:hypothetical protein CCHOA_03235 [Corynebacterium choanae]
MGTICSLREEDARPAGVVGVVGDNAGGRGRCGNNLVGQENVILPTNTGWVSVRWG